MYSISIAIDMGEGSGTFLAPGGKRRNLFRLGDISLGIESRIRRFSPRYAPPRIDDRYGATSTCDVIVRFNST